MQAGYCNDELSCENRLAIRGDSNFSQMVFKASVNFKSVVSFNFAA